MRKKEYAGYLIDLDGTMYNGNEKIKEAAAFVERLRQRKKPFLFLTNNSTSSPYDVSDKLGEVSDVKAYPDEIYTSTKATVAYLKKNNAKKVFVIGESGLQEALIEAGFELTADKADHVVVGLDREVNYEKFETATLLIKTGAGFIATNPDTNIPTEKGLVPGNGALVGFLETSTQTKATVIGKPEAIIMEAALKELALSKEEVLMVGDNYTTDIQAGIQNDIDTLLVLTGFTKAEDVEKLPVSPTYIVENLDFWDIQ